MVSVCKNVGERSTAKNYRLVSHRSVVSKIFDKLINNRLVDDLEKCGLFSDFQYVFRSSHRLLWVSINQPYGFARNTVIMSGLVLSVATWKC